jgi:hypothetical protein
MKLNKMLGGLALGLSVALSATVAVVDNWPKRPLQ